MRVRIAALDDGRVEEVSEVRLPPYEHQVIGADALVRWDNPATGRIFPGCFALFDEPGAGKTKQIIDAACELFTLGDIDRVLIVAPAGIGRDVWFDENIGELATHLWDGLPATITEFHSKVRSWDWCGGAANGRGLQFIVTNYEFFRARETKKHGRNDDNLQAMLRVVTPKTWIVFDESSEVKSPKSEQTKASMILRAKCRRVTLLNGTPVELHPGDLFSQAKLMDPRILGCPTYFHFRSRYAIMGGYAITDKRGNKKPTQIIGWRNLDDIQNRLKPYVLRREKSTVLNLPEKSYFVEEVALTTPTWDLYRSMRDELVAWLGKQVSLAPQAITKVMRLSQITSGVLGGLSDALDFDFQDEEMEIAPEGKKGVDLAVQFVGREKLDWWLARIASELTKDPNHKMLAWCRFKPELDRMVVEVRRAFPQTTVEAITGDQKREERLRALMALHPTKAPTGSVVVHGSSAAGGRGLNLTAAWDVYRISEGTRHGRRVQAEDRNHRPGQKHDVRYTDLLATGPKGQKTIDHGIFQSHVAKANLAEVTCSAWIDLLTQE